MDFKKREMLKKDRALDREKTEEILKAGEYGILSTISDDGTPYGIPLNYVYSQEDNAIYFHCAGQGHKIENLKANPLAVFTVVGQTKVVEEKYTSLFESAVVFTKAEILQDAEEKIHALTIFCEKYTPTQMDKAPDIIRNSIDRTTMVKLVVQNMTGKSNVS